MTTTRDKTERMAAAAMALGMDPLWAIEIARAAAATLIFGYEEPEETIRTTIRHRRATPGAGRPARFHPDLPPEGYDDAIVAAMANEWRRGDVT